MDRIKGVALALCVLFFSVIPSTAAPSTNSFTGSVSVPEWVTFATTGSMNVARGHHTATLLNNGKVLVAGGYNDVSSLASAELYDPGTGTWTSTGSMNSARAYHTATLLNNGEVLVAGGIDRFSSLTSAELYDPVAGTWSPTGSMNSARAYHTATLLNNGKVLVAGGCDRSSSLASAEMYDPVAGTWSPTGSMNIAHFIPTATLLNNGKVLVAGGIDGSSYASAELYDPVAGTWSTTGSMNGARWNRTATLLNNGKVLVAGGVNNSGPLASAELYDPSTGTWSTTGSMSVARSSHTATLLNNGKVLVSGGATSAELYDPVAGTWSTSDSTNVARSSHTATLLNNGKVLVAGGGESGSYASAELATFMPGNTFTGTLTLPSGWLSGTTISAQFVGTSSAAVINAGALSNDKNTWGDWVAATSGVTTTTTWNVSGEGANKPVYLRLRDVNDQVATVVTGTVNVDLTKPMSTMTPLPATSPANIALAWSGSDALSGVAGYDLQVRAGSAGLWTDVLTNTPATSTTYNGNSGTTYYFRVRSKDAVGNVEEWPPTYDTYTLVDTDAPTGTLVINNGAFSTTSTGVNLTLSAQDVSGSVAQMSFSNDGTTWGDWQTYAGSANWSLTSGDGLKTVYVRFKDVAGNMSSPVSRTITLDTAAGIQYGVSINDGALFTNQVTVPLKIGALAGTPRMMVSNDGGFSGAQWEPYNSRKPWTITQYGSYVIPRVVYVRYGDVGGTVLNTSQDDIILDVNPPTGSVSITPGVTGSALAVPSIKPQPQPTVSARKSNVELKLYLPMVPNQCSVPTGNPNVTLHLSATDDVSGVGSMIISNRADFYCATWVNYATASAWYVPPGVTTVYVKFRDNAGNVSTVVTAPSP